MKHLFVLVILLSPLCILLALLSIPYGLWNTNGHPSPTDIWVVSDTPTMLIWSTKDLTRANLEASEPKCGIGFASNIGEIYENYNYVYVTMEDTIDYTNVDSTVIVFFTKYGYRDKQEAYAFDIWTNVSYQAVNSGQWVYVKRK